MPSRRRRAMARTSRGRRNPSWCSSDATTSRPGSGSTRPRVDGRDEVGVVCRLEGAMERSEIVLHGHRVSYRTAGQRPAAGPAPRDRRKLGDVGGRDPLAGREPHRHRPRSPRPRRVVQAARETTRSGPTRTPSATFSRRSASRAGRSSGTRSAAGSRCSSPTSSPSAASASCWCRAAASVASSTRCCARRRSRGPRWCCPGSAWPGGAASARAVHALGRLGLRASADLEETWRSFVSLEEPEARQAFLHTVRGIIDLGGQRVSASDRLYLAAELPTLIVWGEHDPLIPVRHAHEAHERIRGSRLEVFPGAGHFPYRDDPRALRARSCSTSSRRHDPCRSTRSACAAGCAPGRSRSPLAEPGRRPEACGGRPQALTPATPDLPREWVLSSRQPGGRSCQWTAGAGGPSTSVAAAA